jgi:hypothetical protein
MAMDMIAEGITLINAANGVLVEDVTPSDCTDLVIYEPFSCVSDAKRLEMLDRYGPAGARNVLTMLSTPSPNPTLKGPWSASEMYPESDDEYAEIMYRLDQDNMATGPFVRNTDMQQRRELGYVPPPPPQNSPHEEIQAPFTFDASQEPCGGGGGMDVDDE